MIFNCYFAIFFQVCVYQAVSCMVDTGRKLWQDMPILGKILRYATQTTVLSCNDMILTFHSSTLLNYISLLYSTTLQNYLLSCSLWPSYYRTSHFACFLWLFRPSLSCHRLIPFLFFDYLFYYIYLGGFTLRERQNSRVRVEITAADTEGNRRKLACTYTVRHSLY